MKESISSRDTLMARYGISLVILFILFTLITSFQFIFLDDIFVRVVRKNMQEAALQIESLDFDSKDYLSKLSDLEAKHDFYIEIYYPREKLIYSSNVNDTVYGESNAENKNELKPRIMKILDHVDLDEKSYFETRQEYFATAKYIVYGTFFGDNAGIELYSSVDVIKANAKTASWAIFWISIVLLFLIKKNINLIK